jgi:tetratricopeptide (TPR) repeat protein
MHFRNLLQKKKTKMTEPQKLEAIIRLLGVAEIKMKKGWNIGLDASLLFGASTSRTLRSWIWYPTWLKHEGKDFQQMWTTSDDGEWLLWFCTHMINQPGWPTHQQLVFASCQCARLALRHIKPGQGRPLAAIEAAEAWTRGEATPDQVRIAARAADYIDHDYVSYCAAQAAYSAAWGVYAEEDGSCFRLAQALSGAASQTATAASYETAKAASSHTGNAMLFQCAELVRQTLEVPKFITNEFTTLQSAISCPKNATEPNESNRLWMEGYNALERGKDLYFKKEYYHALSNLDIAIASGFEGADAYGMRGGCLQSLRFDLDAIDDLTKAIEFDPQDSNNYFMRSISKAAVGDLRGRVDDLKMAIRLACIDGPTTHRYNSYAREKGFKDGVADMYRAELVKADQDIIRQASEDRRIQSRDTDLADKRPSLSRRRK